MPEKILTQARLRALLDYDPYTGDLIWKITRNQYAQRGSIAGTIDIDLRNGDKRRRIMVDGTIYYASRLIWLWMTGSFPLNDIDHQDQDSLNDRWENLRDIDHGENMQNLRIYKNNKSGYPGVYWHKKNQRWAVEINVNRESIFLGCFIEKADAIKARKAAEKRYGFHPNHGRERSAA